MTASPPTALGNNINNGVYECDYHLYINYHLVCSHLIHKVCDFLSQDNFDSYINIILPNRIPDILFHFIASGPVALYTNYTKLPHSFISLFCLITCNIKALLMILSSVGLPRISGRLHGFSSRVVDRLSPPVSCLSFWALPLRPPLKRPQNLKRAVGRSKFSMIFAVL